MLKKKVVTEGMLESTIVYKRKSADEGQGGVGWRKRSSCGSSLSGVFG